MSNNNNRIRFIGVLSFNGKTLYVMNSTVFKSDVFEDLKYFNYLKSAPTLERAMQNGEIHQQISKVHEEAIMNECKERSV